MESEILEELQHQTELLDQLINAMAEYQPGNYHSKLETIINRLDAMNKQIDHMNSRLEGVQSELEAIQINTQS